MDGDDPAPLTQPVPRPDPLEAALRHTTSLCVHRPLHPSPAEFPLQEPALDRYHELQANGYNTSQIGVFAREVGDRGQRRFIVDTFAGFVLDNGPGTGGLEDVKNQHLYAVVTATAWTVHRTGHVSTLSSQEVTREANCEGESERGTTMSSPRALGALRAISF